MKIKLLLFLLLPIIGVSQSNKVFEHSYESVIVYENEEIAHKLKGNTVIKYNCPKDDWISVFANESLQMELKPIEEAIVSEIDFFDENRLVEICELIDTRDSKKIKVIRMLDIPESKEVHFWVHYDDVGYIPLQTFLTEDYINEFYNEKLNNK